MVMAEEEEEEEDFNGFKRKEAMIDFQVFLPQFLRNYRTLTPKTEITSPLKPPP